MTYLFIKNKIMVIQHSDVASTMTDQTNLHELKSFLCTNTWKRNCAQQCMAFMFSPCMVA